MTNLISQETLLNEINHLYNLNYGEQLIDPQAFYEMVECQEIIKKQQDNRWIPFKTEYDEDLKMNMLQCEIPNEEQEVLVTDGKSTWCDVFMKDEIGWYLDSGNDLIDKVTAWQPLPEPFKEEEPNEQ